MASFLSLLFRLLLSRLVLVLHFQKSKACACAWESCPERRPQHDRETARAQINSACCSQRVTRTSSKNYFERQKAVAHQAASVGELIAQRHRSGFDHLRRDLIGGHVRSNDRRSGLRVSSVAGGLIRGVIVLRHKRIERGSPISHGAFKLDEGRTGTVTARARAFEELATHFDILGRLDRRHVFVEFFGL
jgi:hypothetical protein